MHHIIMDSQILTALQTCPRYAHLRFNECLIPKEGKSNAIECGSLVHTFLEFYHKAIIAGASRTNAIDTGFAAFNEYLIDYQDTNKYITDTEHIGVKNVPHGDDVKDGKKNLIGTAWLIHTIEEYLEYTSSDNFTPLHVEFVKGAEIYADEEMRITWKAKYDLIADFADGIMPMDHKTSSVNSETSDMNNQFMGQCILTNTRRMMVNKIGFQKSLSPDEKFKREIMNYSADRLHEWRTEIVPHYARMLIAYNEAENFPPQFTSCKAMYGWCQYKRNICDSDRNVRESNKLIWFDKGRIWDISND